MTDRIAVITIAHGRAAHLLAQHRSLARSIRRPDHYVVVAMGDRAISSRSVDGLASDVVHLDADPRLLPLAAARNLGADTAICSGADVLVFLDVDCLADPGLVGGYRSRSQRDRDWVWSGPVTYLPPPPAEGYDLQRLEHDPHPSRPDRGPGVWSYDQEPDLFWSLSFAMHREAWVRSGGFCEDYAGYGAEDTDFAAHCHDRGVGLGWTGDARAFHQHHPVSRPPVEHVDDILRNARIFHRRWGRWPMVGWLEAFEERGLLVRDDGGWRRCA